MRKYNPKSICPKCGGHRVGTKWNDNIEEIERFCERCFYKWNELPLDSEE